MSANIAVEVNPQKVVQADMVVGVSSHNDADFIRGTTTQADRGLVQYFGERSCVIINCDSDSQDNTKGFFLETPSRTPKIYISTPAGARGKGNNLRNLFQKAVDLQAKGVVVLDADLQSVTPEWIRYLGVPLFSGFSYVAPLYVRHKYEGLVTNCISYPLTRCLYGRRVRQPAGGDFGVSGKMAGVFLEGKGWDDAVSHHGIDLWMTTLAINERGQICQSFLGKPKIRRTGPQMDPGPIFREEVETIFSLMKPFESHWRGIKYSRPTAIYGFGMGESEAPPKVSVDTLDLLAKFQEGLQRFRDIWEEILPEDLYKEISELGKMREGEFKFPTELWARILFDAAVAYRDSVVERERIVDSLLPLYFGRTLSFVRRTKRMSVKQSEEIIEEDCIVFETEKPHLLKRWAGQ